MCLICKDVAKESLEPNYFWNLYREVDDEHKKELLEVVKSTSAEYQTNLANEPLRRS